MRLYFIPEASTTGNHLAEFAESLNFVAFQEACIASPRIDIGAHPEMAKACTRKKSLVRHENFFRRNGELEIRHFISPQEILPHLDDFFAQHIARRRATGHPSIFEEQLQRDYYRRIVRNVGPTGWLRFTRLDWNGRAIAFHFGLSFERRFLFGIPSFAIELKHRSPGEVLLKQLIQVAIDERAEMFDFATGECRLITWGLYPKEFAPGAERVR
jgi:CelD/BcsL family acetyltransferase involved in cellulose biosynthesis